MKNNHVNKKKNLHNVKSSGIFNNYTTTKQQQQTQQKQCQVSTKSSVKKQYVRMNTKIINNNNKNSSTDSIIKNPNLHNVKSSGILKATCPFLGILKRRPISVQ
jgi:hypothetical protein